MFFDTYHAASISERIGGLFFVQTVGGELNYYFFGPNAEEIIELHRTGRTRSVASALDLRVSAKPLQLLSESARREIVATYRQRNSAGRIYFDIDYQQGNAPFTINRQYFPTFDKMISDFRSQGVHTVLITDLHIKKDPNPAYTPYATGMQRDVFVKNPDGSVFVGPVWPGDSVFPDFTLTKARDWWGEQYKDFVNMGVAGFWNDMNEPSVFQRADKTMPLDTRHRLDTGLGTTARFIMSMEWKRARHL